MGGKITGKDSVVWAYFRRKGETKPKNNRADVWLEAVSTDNSCKGQEKEMRKKVKSLRQGKCISSACTPVVNIEPVIQTGAVRENCACFTETDICVATLPFHQGVIAN